MQHLERRSEILSKLTSSSVDHCVSTEVEGKPVTIYVGNIIQWPPQFIAEAFDLDPQALDHKSRVFGVATDENGEFIKAVQLPLEVLARNDEKQNGRIDWVGRAQIAADLLFLQESAPPPQDA